MGQLTVVKNVTGIKWLRCLENIKEKQIPNNIA